MVAHPIARYSWTAANPFTERTMTMKTATFRKLAGEITDILNWATKDAEWTEIPL